MGRGDGRSVVPAYLVRQRQFIEYRPRAYGRPRPAYSKWVTILRTLDREKARQVRDEKARIGLNQTIVTIRGQVVFDDEGVDRRSA